MRKQGAAERECFANESTMEAEISRFTRETDRNLVTRKRDLRSTVQHHSRNTVANQPGQGLKIRHFVVEDNEHGPSQLGLRHCVGRRHLVDGPSSAFEALDEGNFCVGGRGK